MIEYYKRTNIQEKIERLDGFSKDCWIRVLDPSPKEIDFLVDKFNIEKDLVLDGLDMYETPRIEEEDEKVYIYLNLPTKEIENEYTGSFLVIISKDLFITISKFDMGLLEKIGHQKKGFLTNQRTRSLLQVLSFLSNEYSFNIRSILKEVKKDRRNIRNLSNKDILDLVLQEDILNEYLSSFFPLVHIHAMMLKLKSLKFKENEKEFIEDLIINLNQTLNSCKSALKTITNMRDYYATTLSNNLNKILKILTLFTVFLTIPTVLSGIYGMNITLPGQNLSFIFIILIGIVVLTWIIVLVLFKKMKIL